MGRISTRRTISLPPELDDQLVALADQCFDGNVSAAVAHLIECHKVETCVAVAGNIA